MFFIACELTFLSHGNPYYSKLTVEVIPLRDY